MRIYQDGDQTVIDGEYLHTFIKFGQVAAANNPDRPVMILGGAIAVENAVSKHRIQAFSFEHLTGNPFKDCFRLLQWYFR